MPFDDLTRFLQAASDHAELLRISEPVLPRRHVAAITELVCAQDRERSPVLLFERVGDSSIPVVTNQLGGRARLLRCLGTDTTAAAADRVLQLLLPYSRSTSPSPDGGSWDRAGQYAPRVVRRGACQHVVKLGGDFDLRQLPMKRLRNGEERSVLTSATVLFRDARALPHLARLTLEVVSANQLLIDWEQGNAEMQLAIQAYQSRQQGLPVAIVLGGDPLLSFAAGLPLPDGLDPFRFLGALRGDPLNLVRGRAVEIDVPADAEIVIEGYVEAGMRGDASDAGEVAATSGSPSQGPRLLEVTAMTHRANPILPFLVHSERFDESFVWSELTEQIALNWLRVWNPATQDLHLPRLGCHRRLAFVKTTAVSSHERQALAYALLSLPLLSEATAFVLVGENVNPRETDAVLSTLLKGFGERAAGLLASSALGGDVTRFVIDATRATISRGHPEDASTEPQLREILKNAGWHVG